MQKRPDPLSNLPAAPSADSSSAGDDSRPQSAGSPLLIRSSTAKRRQKKPSPREGRESFFPPLLTACIIFAVAAGVCFWGINHIRRERTASFASGYASETDDSFRILPRINLFGGRGDEDRRAGTYGDDAEAVASALAELQDIPPSERQDLPQGLPYEESLSPSLEERIRQVDYALMQAVWMRSLPASNIRLTGLQRLHHGDEPYHTQALDILSGGSSPADSAQEFILSLRDSLSVWVDTAELRHEKHVFWSIRLGDLETHRLRLYADPDAFAAGACKAVAGGFPPDSPLASGNFRPYSQEGARDIGHTSGPRLVIVIDDLGESMQVVNRLLALDYPVTFAFWPYAAHTAKGAPAAHRNGREILVHQPMEPEGYPEVKPGPGVLLTGMSTAEIRRQVLAGIAKVPYAVGLNNHMGSRFTRSRGGAEAVAAALLDRNLFMLDSLTHNGSVFADAGRRFGLRTYRRNVFLDVAHTKRNVLDQLRQAERIALFTGQSIAIGHPLPETLAALEEWQRLRNRNVRIVRLQDL